MNDVKKLAAFFSIWEGAAQLSFYLLFMNTEMKNEFCFCVFTFYVYLAFHRRMVVFTSVGVFKQTFVVKQKDLLLHHYYPFDVNFR